MCFRPKRRKEISDIASHEPWELTLTVSNCAPWRITINRFLLGSTCTALRCFGGRSYSPSAFGFSSPRRRLPIFLNFRKQSASCLFWKMCDLYFSFLFPLATKFKFRKAVKIYKKLEYLFSALKSMNRLQSSVQPPSYSLHYTLTR